MDRRARRGEGRHVGHGQAEHDDSDAVVVQRGCQREERGHAVVSNSRRAARVSVARLKVPVGQLGEWVMVVN